MCGIAGVMDSRLSADEIQDATARMGATMVHRGPDAGGEWVHPAMGVALAHRRLAIIDLSPQGQQPMTSQDGRLTLTFNGEIYNYRHLRTRLQQDGVQMRSQSDTEVLLEACAIWGVERALQDIAGMFAFAVWDEVTRTLTLARDRMGEKPLYHAFIDGRFVFGSELRAVTAGLGRAPTIDQDAVADLLSYGYVPTPRSIFRGVSKLPAGTTLQHRLDDTAVRPPRAYWSLSAVAAKGHEDIAPSDAVDGLDDVLSTVVQQQMIADVGLGTFLSGGVDSSAIAAVMQASGGSPIKTFTIGFADTDYDEAPAAAQFARAIGTQHHQLYVTPEDILALVPDLPTTYDEPFADSSQLPMVILSRLTRSHVTVALSGDGGDELFGGYERHRAHAGFWAGAGRVPRPLRSSPGRLMQRVPPSAWERLGSWIPDGRRPANIVDKANKVARLLAAASPDDGWESMRRLWPDAHSMVPGSRGDSARLLLPSGLDERSRVMLVDSLTYLPDDILVKVDRAAMASSLETRVPLLDHRVVEYVWSLPPALKHHDGQSKWPLRELLRRRVPEADLSAPKRGFAVPLAAWLRGPLREWASDLLAADRVSAHGLLDPAPIGKAWTEHLDGEQNHQHRLWAVLMLQSWLERQ